MKKQAEELAKAADDRVPELEQSDEQEEYTLTPEQVLVEFQRFFLFFNEVIKPYEETKQHASFSPFHLQLMYTVCQLESVTASPRGVLKSQIVSKYRNLHKLVDPSPELYQDEDPTILIVSEGGDLPKEHINWLQDHIENNPYLIERYGSLKAPGGTWNESEIELSNGSSAKAKGITSALRGKHPTDITVDDAESENNIGTEETLNKLKSRFWRVIWPMRRGSRTSLHVVGTILCKGSLLDDLIKSGEFYGKRWKALFTDHEKSNREDGLCSIWPQYWSVDWLIKQRKRMGTHMFNAEFQNEPIGRGDQIIMPEWIRRHRHIEIADMTPIKRYIAVDPAFTEEKWGCFSAIMVLDEMKSGGLYERLNWRGKVTGPALARQIISTFRSMSMGDIDVVLGIEEVAAQKTVRQQINEIAPDIIVNPIRVQKDKTMRLIDVSRYFENGTISLESERLVNEVLEAPHGVMDSVDALVHGLKMYEKDHPLIADNASVELDVLKHLDDTSLGCYLGRAEDGSPNHNVPKDYQKRYQDAMMIDAMLDELGDF